MFSDELILIAHNTTYDEAGMKKNNDVEKHVICEVRSATRREFYDYGTNELRPEYDVTMSIVDYENEKDAIFRGRRYSVTRTYEVSRDLIELTLSRKIQL